MADGNDLISFIASMSGEGNLRVEENLGDGFVLSLIHIFTNYR